MQNGDLPSGPEKEVGKLSEKQQKYGDAALVPENSELFPNSLPAQPEAQRLTQLTVGRTDSAAEARRERL